MAAALLSACADKAPEADTYDPARDYFTFSNTDEFVTEHLTLDLSVDFDAAELRGSAVLTMRRLDMAATEIILDTRDLKDRAGIKVEDIAKRLMDYGFHAPTVSFPVPGTLMIEPTESEPRDELDRLCDALMAIRAEIAAVERGEADRENNVVVRAPHTAEEVIADDWDRPYSRELAAYPAPWTRSHKYWPPVNRIDNVHGDRNFAGCCPPPDAYRTE